MMAKYGIKSQVRKMLLVLIAFTCQHFASAHYRGNITLHVNDAPLREVFKQIEKQTGYSFLFTESQLAKARPVNLHVTNKDIKEVLDLIFASQPFSFTIQHNVIIIKEKPGPFPLRAEATTAADETISVKGQVVNESGEPLSGATVSVKGSAVSTSTNKEGLFGFSSIPGKAVLVFTHVSMKTLEYPVNDNADIVVTLTRDTNQLGQVMVVGSNGYQPIAPDRAAGSFVVLDQKTLNMQAGTDILKRLDNVTSGLTFTINKSPNYPGGGLISRTNILIRGLSTINWSLDPLIVLDNFPYEGDISNINPNDIESVTVLKDGNATSAYGARGGNGVIVITTKKGRFNEPLKISTNFNVSIQAPIDLFSLPKISSADYIDMEQFLWERNFYDNEIYNVNFPPLSPAVEVFLRRSEGIISAADSASLINRFKNTDSRNYFDKYFNKPVVTRQYSLRLQGGTNNLAWAMAANLDKTGGNFDDVNRKVNLHINGQYRPLNGLQVNAAVYYTKTAIDANKSVLPADGLRIGSRLVPYIAYADEVGNPVSVALLLRRAFTDTVGFGKLPGWEYFPLTDYKHDRAKTDLEDIRADLGISYKILDGLVFDLLYQRQRQTVDSRRLSDILSYRARDLINRFSQLNYSSRDVYFPIAPGDVLSLSGSSYNWENLRSQLNYNHAFRNLSIAAIFGGEIREAVIKTGSSSTLYGYRENPPRHATTDFINEYPVLPGGSYSSIPGKPFNGYTNVNHFVSVYTNASLTYKARYTASISARRDGANIFGATTNNRWKPLWSMGAAWNLSGEPFYKLPAIPRLRITTTIGYSGNISPDKTALPVLSYLGNNPITNYPMAQIDQLNDPSLRWEQVMQWKIGVEFSLKNQLITGSVEYYVKKSKDLFGPVPFDYSSGGANTIYKNAASMKGHGLDMVLTSRNIDKRLKWTTTLLFNFNTDKVTQYLADNSELVAAKILSGDFITPVVGKPLYAIAAYRWGGLNAAGDPQGYVNNELSTDYDSIFLEAALKGVSGNIKYIGPAIPPVFGSLINNLEWNNFALSVCIAYKLGYFFSKPSINYHSLFYSGIGYGEFKDRWQKPGDEARTNVPAMVYTDYPQFANRDNFYAGAEINVLRGDHLRWQFINMSYKASLKRLGVPNGLVEFYINLANLGVLWRANKQEIDPDYPNTFSPPKQYTVGFRLNL